MTVATRAVFLSYASQDAPAAERICEALRAVGVDVWLDKNELRGGDAWDAQIRKRIHDCTLFIPVISANTNARNEGYFRREWKQATRRLQDMADDVAFLVPVVIDETREADARVPEEFLSAQWTWLPGGDTPPAFAQRVRHLLGGDGPSKHTAQSAASAKLEPSVRIGQDRKGRMPSFRLLVPALVALLALGAGAFWYFNRASDTPTATTALPPISTETVATPPEKSIAVLPFADMSAEKNQEYMSDGIAEELLKLLAQVPDLKVIARTSSFAFKGRNIEIAEIAKKLNVAHVLEGSVRKSGNKLRITAQLIRTADSTHVWSESYDRSLDDIFAVQDEIANAIVQALRITLMGGPVTRREGGTQNLEAYQLYLRAVSAINQNTKASLDAAEDYGEQATKLDPNYGWAWSTLALTVASQTDNGWLPGKEGYERAQQLALQALKLSPDLAEAHATLAYTYFCLDWNWNATKVELERALAIDPTDPWALQNMGVLSMALGHWDDAEQQLRASLDRDPLNTFTLINLGEAYYLAGRIAEAEDVFRELLELEPDFLWTRRWLSKTLLAQGKPEAALTMIQQESDEANRLAVLPVMLYAVGRKAEADEALNALITRWGDTWPSNVAQIYAYRGDHNSALEWLELAYQKSDVGLTLIIGEPLLKSMADDPRYKAFLRKMKLPEG